MAVASQCGMPPGGKGPIGLVLPLAGAPVSAQQVEERSRILSGGTRSTETLLSRIHRDRAGRLRVEWHISIGGEASSGVIYLFDPVAYSTAILLVESKLASRAEVPRSAPGGFQVGLPAIGEPLPDQKWGTAEEPLGTRRIEGIEAEGARKVLTSESVPPLTARWEKWWSHSLGLTLVEEASGPGWRHTAKLENVDRSEPDPGLFVIPGDYTIQDR